MVFKKNIPQPSDLFEDSQSDLLNNNLQLNTSFGVDHYTFDNITANNGKHNLVTTPEIVGATDPTTAATECKFYARTLAGAGLMQISRGPSDKPITPVTKFQTGNTVIASTATYDVVDFTNFPMTIATLWGTDYTRNGILLMANVVYQNGSGFRVLNELVTTGGLRLVTPNATNILKVLNSTGSDSNFFVFTVEIHRISG